MKKSDKMSQSNEKCDKLLKKSQPIVKIYKLQEIKTQKCKFKWENVTN